ncbi:MAG: DUF3368 domain-containing protein [Prosthecobacter sp.]|uniref:DUF3368 domain-containing protein n=1 Tax=Prosthecobacter sp. TaxID=1965333 RepID=UPI0039020FAA
MLVVSNTSPVSNLAVIGQLALLRDQFGTIIIPDEVEVELSRLRHPPAQREIAQAFADGWLISMAVPAQAPSPLLLDKLDQGERAAIRLALELKANRLLIDEADGRSVATSLGVSITGVVGVLIEAKKRGQLASLKAELHRLRREARFFINPLLESRALAAAGE